MNKYLFTDGTSGVKELLSKEELEAAIENAASKEAVRIWIFSSNEWINCVAYRKLNPAIIKKENAVAISKDIAIAGSPRSAKKSHWLKKTFYVLGAGAVVFLVFNFTKIKWEKANPINISAARPANVPAMDIDSLVAQIEESRGTLLDKSTRTNLRLRNTWPQLIDLRLSTERETSNAGSRYFNGDITIDNTTGFNLDNAVVKLIVWKDNKVNTTDTLRFSNIPYDKVTTRHLESTYRGDSISVAFETIRAKTFNFCYSATTKNNSGNYNDRWFCKE